MTARLAEYLTASFRQGLVVNMLNPPISTFYVAIVPTFMTPGGGGLEFASLAAMHVGIAFGCHMGWALAFDRLRHVFSGRTAARLFETCAGGAVLALAGRMLYRL